MDKLTASLRQNFLLVRSPASAEVDTRSVMATNSTTYFSAVVPWFSPPRHPHPHHLTLVALHSQRKATTICKALGSDMLGDFGARDPFPAELESGFAEKVLGNVDTEHKILIPNVSALSLAQQHCSSLPTPMSLQDAQSLLRKVVGWKLLEEEGGLKLQCLWKLRDFKCGVELVNRIYKVIEDTGHFPNLHLEQPNQVRAELWTSSIGGLSMNDFIVAAKIDQIKTSDLVPRKRIWA